MQRVDIPEILDSPGCPREEIARSLRDIERVNRWFGGVATSQALIERVAGATGKRSFSLLEVGAGSGHVPEIVAKNLSRQKIELEVTLLDRAPSHFGKGTHRAIGADALALPFCEGSFDLISCNLLAHHLQPEQVTEFSREAWRVSRCAVLINDLIRSPVHLALVYAGFPLLRSPVSRFDGAASVRRAYLPREMREMISSAFPSDCRPRIEIFRHYLFRMGVILWRDS